MSKSQWYIDIYLKFFENLPQIYCIMIPKKLVFSTSLYQITLVHRLIFYNFLKSTSNLRNNRYQRVICLSGTSGTRHDTRDQRESLWGRAPHPISGWNLGNFGKFWEILENLEKFWKIYVHRKINVFWKFNSWITSFLLYLAKCALFPSIMAYEILVYSEASSFLFASP